MSGAARAPMLQLKLRKVRSGAQRVGYARPTKSVTADMGTPTLMPRSKNAGASRKRGQTDTARHVQTIAAKPVAMRRA